MPGSAQPERNPKPTSEDNAAGPALATAGFGASKLAETQDNQSNGNSNFGNSNSNSEDHSGDNPFSYSTDNSSERRVPEEGELASTLQLLVERAQYITGATGTALALPQGEEMVCRASAGASAPAVGARLQVKSGLTGESISRRQLLRCDNAEADPRVNLEACRALGIASIVVLPLLRKDGEVRGLFELFSDHPYAFEERDLIALERMAALTLTALDLAEQSQHLPSATPDRNENRNQGATEAAAAEVSQSKKQESSAHEPGQEPRHDSAQAPDVIIEKIIATKHDAKKSDRDEIPQSGLVAEVSPNTPGSGTIGDSPAEGNTTTGEQNKSSPTQEFRMPEHLVVEDLPPVLPSRDLDLGNLVLDAENANAGVPASGSTPVPTAMLRIQKCATCGFPVSEGRALCLDCERKNSHDKNTAANHTDKSASDLLTASLPKSAASLTQQIENEVRDKPANSQAYETLQGKKSDIEAEENVSGHMAVPAADSQSLTTASGTTASETAAEFVPAFLANSAPYRESWLSKNYVNVLAGIVLILCLLVAIVVFR
jgi:putative methionine-R-sulfoxide reductase with GAF domain